jgi:beta-glucanase (GH16 family)
MSCTTALIRALRISLFSGAAAVVAQNSVLLWSDDFDHDATTASITSMAPNASNWVHEVGGGGWGNNEFQIYTDSLNNSYMQDGMLHITALRGGGGGDASGTASNTFTSARLSTVGRVHVKYGTIEAKIKIPNVANGLWPAFWTLGQDYSQVGWPACGEFDIMEIGQGFAAFQGWGLINKRVISAVHSTRNGEPHMEWDSADAKLSLNTDFHRFKLDWTPQTVTTYLDDVPIHSSNIDVTACGGECDELHQPHYLILNLAVGGGFTLASGVPDEPSRITATLPATMLVDWVRIYDNGFTEITTTLTVLDTHSPSQSTTITSSTNATSGMSSTRSPSRSSTTKMPSLAPSTPSPTRTPTSRFLTRSPLTTSPTVGPFNIPTSSLLQESTHPPTKHFITESPTLANPKITSKPTPSPTVQPLIRVPDTTALPLQDPSRARTVVPSDPYIAAPALDQQRTVSPSPGSADNKGLPKSSPGLSSALTGATSASGPAPGIMEKIFVAETIALLFALRWI